MANFDGKIILGNPNGVILKTGGLYCDKDIVITPKLDEMTFLPSTAQQVAEPSKTFCGYKKLRFWRYKPKQRN